MTGKCFGLIGLIALAAAGNGASAASIKVRVGQADGHPFAGAVIIVHDESAHLPPVAPVAAIVDQIHLAFVPDIIVIPLGSTVEFPNSDSVSHQIYSFSSAKRFQLPLYRGKPYPPTRFDQAGIVTLGCNIHDDMVGYVVVTDAPFFGRTDESGHWTAANVPAGKYRVTLWHPLLREEEGSLERVVGVGGEEPTEVAFKLAHALRLPPLKAGPGKKEAY